MSELGQVVEKKDGHVVVLLERKDACGKCNACTVGIESKDMFLEAFNDCDAEEGDIVGVSLSQSNFLKAVGIMYIIPLIAMLAGLGIGAALAGVVGLDAEVSALVFGFLFLAGTFLFIKANDKRFNKRGYRPVADTLVKRAKDI